ncbi:MAG: phenylalanine--tRNA ligase subunit beta [bacterium]|nr:phenylalanine--tRNA ligase subunit beta [bacterium]
MKVTVDWLKQYVDFSQSPKEVASILTMLGLEVDSVRQIAYEFENIIVGEIVAIRKHELKGNLSICTVNTVTETISLVCGAPHVAPGMKVPVAVVGSKLPGGITVKSATIHGYESPGMICSEAELGLSRQSEIIMVLNESARIGQDLKDVLNRGEVVIEIDLTPNRPDCLGAIGIAREIAAFNRSTIKKPKINLNETTTLKTSDVINVIIENPESCPRYTARYLEGIKISHSPHWLIKKLEAVGLRSINNVVDVTNFVMMETGQPLHAFDYDQLKKKTIVVRHAKGGETFTTLDEKEHSLSNQMLMICDGEKPVALAGVMGGLNSEISNSTTRVLLESAYFTPSNIRKTAKTLGISSDSSQRFERGVDPDGLIYALDRASQLIQELAGGKIAQGCIDCNPRPFEKRAIKLRVDRINQLLGAAIPVAEVVDILERLEFKTTANKNIIDVQIPSFRVDIEREVDLIEEVARVYGFNRIVEKSYSLISLSQSAKKEERFSQLLRNISVGIGYNEVLTQSLINGKWAEKFTDNPCVRLKNPLSEDLGTLRTSLIPGMLQIIKWNKNRYINDQRLFELGHIFYWSDPNQSAHCEEQKIAFIRIGNTGQINWLSAPRASTFYDLKGDVLSLFEQLKISNFQFSNAELKFLDNQSLELSIKQTKAGYIGRLTPELLEKLDIQEDIFVAELDITTLFQNYTWDKKFHPIPRYPATKRDISLLIDEQIPIQKVEEVIKLAGNQFLKSARLFDYYKGKQVSQNKKSLTFSLIFFSTDRTLTEKEVDSELESIIQSLKSTLNAQLRA